MSYDDIHSFQCWKRKILDPKKLIFNEYNDPISKEWFFEMVNEKQQCKNHYDKDSGREWYVDGEGYSFSRKEFR